jgi:hypothetical protein
MPFTGRDDPAAYLGGIGKNGEPEFGACVGYAWFRIGLFDQVAYVHEVLKTVFVAGIKGRQNRRPLMSIGEFIPFVHKKSLSGVSSA